MKMSVANLVTCIYSLLQALNYFAFEVHFFRTPFYTISHTLIVCRAMQLNSSYIYKWKYCFTMVYNCMWYNIAWMFFTVLYIQGKWANLGQQLSYFNHLGQQLSYFNHLAQQLSYFNHLGQQLSYFNHLGQQLSYFNHLGQQLSYFNHLGQQLSYFNQIIYYLQLPKGL